MVDWTGLGHAYGAAWDVPALLNSLTPDPADEVWGELWSRICHQGSVYSASFAALPALADAAARWQPRQRAQPLALAGCILASTDCRDKSGRNLVEVFVRENHAVVRRFQELCQESLAQRGLTKEDFIYLLQAACSFDGDGFWGRKLDQLAGGEFSGICPRCGVDLYLVIGKYGYFATAEDWVSRGDSPGTLRPRPGVKLAPIESAQGALAPTAQWMYDRCVAAHQEELAVCVSFLFGTSECTSCRESFSLQDAIAEA
jgi:hypothetical protein